MAWGGISGRYCNDLVAIQGNLTGVCYRDQILAPRVQLFMTVHQDAEMFQQDNAHPHTARV